MCCMFTSFSHSSQIYVRLFHWTQCSPLLMGGSELHGKGPALPVLFLQRAQSNRCLPCIEFVSCLHPSDFPLGYCIRATCTCTFHSLLICRLTCALLFCCSLCVEVEISLAHRSMYSSISWICKLSNTTSSHSQIRSYTYLQAELNNTKRLLGPFCHQP